MQARYEPGPIQDAVDQARDLLGSTRALARLAAKDTSLWSDDPTVQQQIGNSLGWLDVAAPMAERWPALVHFRQEAAADGLTHAVLLGMGGSSLISIVWTEVFQRGPEGLELLVLDSTDPETVFRLRRRLPLDRTLFLVASKSGTTTEPDRFHRYFWGAVQEAGREPARQFVAITDPGTALAQEAQEGHWRAVFLNPADIGGRYSALSLFGLVPAALMDLPGEHILQSALTMRTALAGPDSPAVPLAAFLGGGARAGRDKVTLAFQPELAPLATWLEQLLAESTGKQGTGLVPVPESRLGAPAAYGPDRQLVRLSLVGAAPDPRFDALKSQHPAAVLTVENPIELGGQFLLWEAATALVGRVLGINPFDQPNVQESKDNTKAMLAQYQDQGALPAVAGAAALLASSPALGPALEGWSAGIEPPEYAAIMAYLPESETITALLQELQEHLRDRLGTAVTVGYGPRFLHSTGQLHKGGPLKGRFLQITAEPGRVETVPIPGVPESFNILIQAQSRGDLKALAERRRPVLEVATGRDIEAGLKALLAAVQTL
jgi:glucose-6-phosphate isomerase